MEQITALGWIGISLLWATCGGLAYLIARRNETGRTPMLLGLLLGPLGIIVALSLDARKTCPRCHARLSRKPQSCSGCSIELFWDGPEPRTERPNEGDRLRRQDEERRAKEASVQQWRRRLVESNAVNIRRREIRQQSVHRILDLPGRFDRGMKDLIGNENELVYRFAQLVLYVLVPLVICLLAVLTSPRSDPAPSQSSSASHVQQLSQDRASPP